MNIEPQWIFIFLFVCLIAYVMGYQNACISDGKKWSVEHGCR